MKIKVVSIVLLLIFTLTTISTVGTAHADSIFFDGGGDGVNWSDPANWDGDTLPIPEGINIAIDDAAGDSNVVLDIDYSTGFFSLSITGGDMLTVAEGKTLTTRSDTIYIDTGATLIVRGALAGDGLVLNNGLLQVCIETGSIADGLQIRENAPEFIQCKQAVGGTIIPIDTTALLLAGAQSFSWMIPVVLSSIGIGLFVVSRTSKNS